jgi:hypothetical protein
VIGLAVEDQAQLVGVDGATAPGTGMRSAYEAIE